MKISVIKRTRRIKTLGSTLKIRKSPLRRAAFRSQTLKSLKQRRRPQHRNNLHRKPQQKYQNLLLPQLTNPPNLKILVQCLSQTLRCQKPILRPSPRRQNQRNMMKWPLRAKGVSAAGRQAEALLSAQLQRWRGILWPSRHLGLR